MTGVVGARLALKFLKADGISPYQGMAWNLPNGKPGTWKTAGKGVLVQCQNGIHACTLEQSFDWFSDRAFLIELGGKVIEGDNKLVARKGRLIRELPWNPRLFAADCAEHVLHFYEDKYPNDDRPRKAIEAARSGDAAARAAAGAAAGAAAWAAEREWQLKTLRKHLRLKKGELV